MINDLIVLFFGHPTYNFSFPIRKLQFLSKLRRKWRKAKRTAKAPICAVLGHSTYESNDWSYSRIYCIRCNYMKSLRESSRSNV